MRGSPVKLGIIIVLAVVGIVTLASGFDSGVPTVPTGDTSTTQSPGLPKPSKSPRVKDVVTGVHVGVYNGTKVTGEAAIVAKKLTNGGYVVDETGNTVDPVKTTTVYFVRPADEEAANALATAQFAGAAVEQKPEGLMVQDPSGDEISPVKSAHLLIFVGDDYLST